MEHARAFFPEIDRAQKVCDALVDTMEQAPAVYNFFAQEGFDPLIREYAAAVAAGWSRSYLKSYPKTRAALKDENWAHELASAALQAWEELEPDSPMKRSTSYRDTLPKTKDGRRQRAKGPQSYINLTDAILSGREGKPADRPELELAQFADKEEMLKRAQDAGLPPREMEVFKFFVENPGSKNREAADKLRMSVDQVKQHKHRMKKTLNTP
jgi:DNA-binding CsgD family transcriptional regulator